MVRPKYDEHKDKQPVSIRLDELDKQILRDIFGSVQMGIDVYMELIERGDHQEELAYLEKLIRERRNK